MAAPKKKRSFLYYLTPILEFLIGVFGALAIIGVYMKITKAPNYEFYMQVGFLGEAAAFIIMGLFALLGGFAGKKEEATEGGQTIAVKGPDASFREMMSEEMAGSLDAAMQTLTDEVHRFSEEMRVMGSEMEQTRSAVRTMRSEMSAMGENGFADDATVLSQSMQQLGSEIHAMGNEMGHSRAAVEQARAVLSKMASSQLVEDAQKFEEGIHVLGEEVHAMGTEMAPAREAIQGMRDELSKVVSGHLAEDAERLSTGMSQLGDEMSQAGYAVEQIRADLEHMSLRFRQFNDPVHEPVTNGVVTHH